MKPLLTRSVERGCHSRAGALTCVRFGGNAVRLVVENAGPVLHAIGFIEKRRGQGETLKLEIFVVTLILPNFVLD